MRNRILALLLSFVLLLSLLPVGVFAGGPGDDTESSIIIGENDGMNEIVERISDATQTILKNGGDAAKASQVAAANWQFSFSKLFDNMKSISSLIGLVNGTVTLLRMTGVMRDPTAAKLTAIYDCVKDIQTTVNQIDAKVDGIEQLLLTEFGDMKMEFRSQEFYSNQEAWRDFYADAVQPLLTLQEEYADGINQVFIDYAKAWQRNDAPDLRVLYGADETPVYSGDNLSGAGKALPPQPIVSDDGIRVAYDIILPGKILYAYMSNLPIKADNYESTLREALHRAVYDAAKAGQLLSYQGFDEQWEALDAAGKQALADAIAEDMMDTLAFEVAHTVSNSNPVASNGIFAARVKSAYDYYCKCVDGSYGAASPVTAQLKMLALTHGFEGESKEDVLVLYDYLQLMNLNFSGFAALVLASSDTQTDAARDEVQKEWMSTMKATSKLCCDFLTGDDNYCYLLGKTIEYRPVRFSSTMTASSRYECDKKGSYTRDKGTNFAYLEDIRSTPWVLEDRSASKTLKDESTLVSRMLSSLDMVLLQCMYAAYSSEESGSFADYLTANKVADRSITAKQLISSEYTKQSFALSEGIPMQVAVKGDAESNYINTSTYVVKTDSQSANRNDKIEDQYFAVHDQVTGDVFDAKTGAVNVNANLAARAFYGENHWNWFIDEMYFLCDTEYSYQRSGQWESPVMSFGLDWFCTRTDKLSCTKDYGALCVASSAASGLMQTGGLLGASSLPYSDVAADAWYVDGVRACVEMGWMQGVSVERFAPEAGVRRQQLWMILARIDGAAPENMAEAKAWAKERGITDGSDPTEFLSRQQLAAMLYRFAGSPAVGGAYGFSDSAKVSSYARDAVAWCAEQGIIRGYADGSFRPAAGAGRGQPAVMLERFAKCLDK